MGPVSYTLIDHVNAPIDTVFAALTDPHCVEQWLPGCSAVVAPGPVRKGSKLQAKFGARTSELDVVDFQPPNTFGWVERRQRRDSKTFFRLDPAGVTTAITIRQVWAAPPVGAWLRGRFFTKRNAQQHSQSIFSRLCTLLTPEPTQPAS